MAKRGLRHPAWRAGAESRKGFQLPAPLLALDASALRFVRSDARLPGCAGGQQAVYRVIRRRFGQKSLLYVICCGLGE